MSTNFASILADQWLNAKHQTPTNTERNDFRLWLIREFARMRGEGIEPLFVTREVSIDEAMAALDRVTLPGEIRWLPVSRLNNDPNVDLMSQQQNLMFRAVHDWIHHKINADASFDGEVNVALEHIKSAPESIHWLLWSEVAGQAAVTLTTGNFPEQKLAKLAM
jgi:hypothetical protein